MKNIIVSKGPHVISEHPRTFYGIELTNTLHDDIRDNGYRKSWVINAIDFVENYNDPLALNLTQDELSSMKQRLLELENARTY